MPQAITSIAVLGARYPSGIQYRVFDAAGTFYPGPGDNLASGTHLGNGVWRTTAVLPDAGGEVRWYASGGANLLVVDVIGPTLAPQIVELHRKAGLDPAAPVTRTRNANTGTVAETFTGATINHVESQNASVVTTTRQP